MDWDVYTSTRGERRFTVAIDLSPAADGPDPRRPWCMRYTLTLRAPAPDGRLDEAERPEVDELGRRLLRGLSGCRPVARVTGDGRSTWIVYGAAPVEPPPLPGLPYAWDLTAQEDPGWATWRSWFPGEDDLRRIADLRGLALLRDARAEDPALLAFTLRFPHVDATMAAAAALAGEDLRQGEDPDDFVLPWLIQLRLQVPLDEAVLLPLSESLAALARFHGGRLTGWEPASPAADPLGDDQA